MTRTLSTPQGQRPCDLADEEVLSLLEELAQKQEDVSPAARWWDPIEHTPMPMAAPCVQLGRVGQGGPSAKPPWVDGGLLCEVWAGCHHPRTLT